MNCTIARLHDPSFLLCLSTDAAHVGEKALGQRRCRGTQRTSTLGAGLLDNDNGLREDLAVLTYTTVCRYFLTSRMIALRRSSAGVWLDSLRLV